MKKQNKLLLLLGILVVIGGIWLLTRESEEGIGNGTEVEDASNGLEDKENEVDSSSEEQDVPEEDDEQGKAEEDSVDEEIKDKAEEPTEDDKDQANQPVSDIEVGKPAPDFELKTLSGESVSLSDYQDKIVLLNFWATTCGFCIEEMPDLDRLDKEYDDVVVLAIDVMEEEAKVRDYIESGGYDFEVALDSEGQVSEDYLIVAYPTSYFIETDGTLIGRVQGMLKYEQMVEILESIRSNR